MDLAERSPEQLSVVVAVLTRRRPGMLTATLGSFDRLVPPEGCSVRYLVVENDDAPRARGIVEDRGGSLSGGPLDYVLETELGIPFGRNRAAKHAIGTGSRLLAFIDDDEIVDPHWLRNLIRGYRQSGAMLLGAPLRAAPAAPDLGWTQRKLHQGIVARYARKERRAARKAGLDGTPGVTIVTNNWLADTRIFSEHGIWFDEAMRFTGGTDAKLSADVKAKGLPTAWIRDAFVYET
ncbi:MAG: glycosyltransferase, partial [Pseudomonadota bacterium]